MMIGEFLHTRPTVQIPPHWDPYEDPTAEIISPFSSTPSFGSPDYINYNNNPFNKPDSFGSLQRYDSDDLSDEFPDLPPDAFTSDNFRMYEFKVRRCSRGRSHDWTECPFAHPGEKARRRDPSKYNYSGTACPEFRKGACRRGETCEFAHGVFECWLHPDRYRTQACKDGIGCRRRICFFAHSPEQLRVVNLQSPNRSLKSFRRSFDSYTCTNVNNINNMTSFGLSSPTTSPPCSPPISLSSLVSNMRNLQLASPTSVWGLSTVGSPMGGANLRHGFCSGPTTPTRVPRLSQFDEWECGNNPEVGLELRAKLSKEKCFGSVKECDPDVGWISDLVQ